MSRCWLEVPQDAYLYMVRVLTYPHVFFLPHRGPRLGSKLNRRGRELHNPATLWQLMNVPNYLSGASMISDKG